MVSRFMPFCLRLFIPIMSALVAIGFIFLYGWLAYRIPQLARLELQLAVYLFFIDWALLTLIPCGGYALACKVTQKTLFPPLLLFALLHTILLPTGFYVLASRSDHLSMMQSMVVYGVCLIVLPPLLAVVIAELLTQ